MPTKGVEGVAD